MVRFSCPTCGQHFAGDESYYGRQLQCPSCLNSFTVPAPAPAAKNAPPPPPYYPPNQLPPKKSRTALMAVVGVLAFLFSAAAAFIVVQRLMNPSTAVVEQTSAKPASQAKAVGKTTGAKTAAKQQANDSGPLAASDIIQRVNDAYGALTSYSAEGKVVTDMDMSKVDLASVSPQLAKQSQAAKQAQAAMAKPQHLEASFSMKLAKPNLYRVDWKSEHGPMKSSGATWSAGDGDYVFMGIMPPKYVKLPSREMALGTAAGVSQGAAYTVPSFFFDGKKSFLDTLENVALGTEEAIDGNDCYVLTGDVRGLKVNLWVDKSTFYIRQKQQVLGGGKVPEMKEKDIDAALKQLGGDATPEKRAQMKAMMQNARAMSAKIKGTITETYQKIEANQDIPKDQFKYEVPFGVELSKSLF